MGNILLSVMFAAVQGAAEVPEGFVEKLLYGLQIAAIGLCIVFTVLAIIMGVLYLFEFFFYTLPNRQKNEGANAKAQQAVKAQQKSSAKVAPAVNLPAVSAEDEDEIAAVIAAAIAAYYEQTAPTSKYRIKSFRRI